MLPVNPTSKFLANFATKLYEQENLIVKGVDLSKYDAHSNEAIPSRNPGAAAHTSLSDHMPHSADFGRSIENKYAERAGDTSRNGNGAVYGLNVQTSTDASQNYHQPERPNYVPGYNGIFVSTVPNSEQKNGSTIFPQFDDQLSKSGSISGPHLESNSTLLGKSYSDSMRDAAQNSILIQPANASAVTVRNLLKVVESPGVSGVIPSSNLSNSHGSRNLGQQSSSLGNNSLLNNGFGPLLSSEGNYLQPSSATKSSVPPSILPSQNIVPGSLTHNLAMARIHDETEDLKSRLSRANEQVSSLLATIERLTEDSTGSQRQIRDLQQKLEKTHQSERNALSQAASLQSQVHSLQKEWEDSQSRYETEKKALEAQYAEASKRLSNVKTTVNTSSDRDLELLELERDKMAISKELLATQTQLNELRAQMQRQQPGALDAKSDDLGVVGASSARARTSIAEKLGLASRESLARANDTVVIARESTERLRQQLEADAAALKARVAELEVLLSASTMKVGSLKREKADLEGKLAALIRSPLKKAPEATTRPEEVVELEFSLQEAILKNAEASQTIGQLTDLVESLQGALKKKEAEIANFQASNQPSTKKNPSKRRSVSFGGELKVEVQSREALGQLQGEEALLQYASSLEAQLQQQRQLNALHAFSRAFKRMRALKLRVAMHRWRFASASASRAVVLAENLAIIRSGSAAAAPGGTECAPLGIVGADASSAPLLHLPLPLELSHARARDVTLDSRSLQSGDPQDLQGGLEIESNANSGSNSEDELDIDLDMELEGGLLSLERLAAVPVGRPARSKTSSTTPSAHNSNKNKMEGNLLKEEPFSISRSREDQWDETKLRHNAFQSTIQERDGLDEQEDEDGKLGNTALRRATEACKLYFHFAGTATNSNGDTESQDPSKILNIVHSQLLLLAQLSRHLVSPSGSPLSLPRAPGKIGASVGALGPRFMLMFPSPTSEHDSNLLPGVDVAMYVRGIGQLVSALHADLKLAVLQLQNAIRNNIGSTGTNSVDAKETSSSNSRLTQERNSTVDKVLEAVAQTTSALPAPRSRANSRRSSMEVGATLLAGSLSAEIESSEQQQQQLRASLVAALSRAEAAEKEVASLRADAVHARVRTDLLNGAATELLAALGLPSTLRTFKPTNLLNLSCPALPTRSSSDASLLALQPAENAEFSGTSLLRALVGMEAVPASFVQLEPPLALTDGTTAEDTGIKLLEGVLNTDVTEEGVVQSGGVSAAIPAPSEHSSAHSSQFVTPEALMWAARQVQLLKRGLDSLRALLQSASSADSNQIAHSTKNDLSPFLSPSKQSSVLSQLEELAASPSDTKMEGSSLRFSSTSTIPDPSHLISSEPVLKRQSVFALLRLLEAAAVTALDTPSAYCAPAGSSGAAAHAARAAHATLTGPLFNPSQLLDEAKAAILAEGTPHASTAPNAALIQSLYAAPIGMPKGGIFGTANSVGVLPVQQRSVLPSTSQRLLQLMRRGLSKLLAQRASLQSALDTQALELRRALETARAAQSQQLALEQSLRQLSAEHDAAQLQLQAGRNEMEALRQTLEEQEAQLSKRNRSQMQQLTDLLAACESELRTRETELAASAKRETDAQHRLRRMQTELEASARSLEQEQKENDSLRQSLNALDIEVHAAEERAKSSSAAAEEARQQLQTLVQASAALESELQALKKEKQELSAEAATLARALRQSSEDMGILKGGNAQEKRQAAQLSKAVADLTSELEKQAMETMQLQQELETLRAQKDQEIEEIKQEAKFELMACEERAQAMLAQRSIAKK